MHKSFDHINKMSDEGKLSFKPVGLNSPKASELNYWLSSNLSGFKEHSLYSLFISLLCTCDSLNFFSVQFIAFFVLNHNSFTSVTQNAWIKWPPFIFFFLSSLKSSISVLFSYAVYANSLFQQPKTNLTSY